MLSNLFIDRPRLAFVISIVITLAGLIALTRIPVAQFPDIVPPQVRVTAVFPGASAEVVESTVAQPIESQVNGVSDMLYMKSTSGNDGSYTLTVTFARRDRPGYQHGQCAEPRQAGGSQAAGGGSRGRGWTSARCRRRLLQVISLYSPNGTYDGLFLSNYVTINLTDALARIPGVGQASQFGALDYSMRVWLDQTRLTNFGLTSKDVSAAIGSQNVQAPVGRIGAEPISEDQQFQFSLQTKGRLTTPEEFAAIIVRANPDGSVVRVSDVGAGRAGREIRRPVEPAERQARRDAGRLSGAGRQCRGGGGGGPRHDGTAGGAVPRRYQV